jgi:hypothetical protein
MAQRSEEEKFERFEALPNSQSKNENIICKTILKNCMTKELVKDPMEELVQLGHSYVSMINQKLMSWCHKSCVLFGVIID